MKRATNLKTRKLSLFAFPETLLFANPAAILACAADAIAATAGNPTDVLLTQRIPYRFAEIGRRLRTRSPGIAPVGAG